MCWGTVVLLHAPVLNLPYFWDEAGYYIPAARDFYQTGDVLPRSTARNPHPPLLSLYLAAAWHAFGESPLVTRLAMTLVAGAALYAVLLLALLVVPPAVGLWATALTALSPVFFAQSTLAHLDVAAALGSVLAIYFYLRRQLASCALALTLLCLARETGAVLVVVLAAAEFFRGSRRTGLALLLALTPLAAWFVLLRVRTGTWFGDAEFAAYNVWGVMDPVRWLLQLAKRIYQVAIFQFHWPAALLIVIAAWLRKFTIPAAALQVFVWFAAAHIVFMGVFGGAPLTRYLLPLFPLFFLMAANAAWSLRFPGRSALILLLPFALVTSWFWNPPHPFGYEDNLAYADFVRLHQQTAPLLEALPPGTRILTAWPASDELARPWLGYVSRPLTVVPIREFSVAELERVDPASFDVLFLYSRQWRPEWFDRHPRIAAIQRRYFGITPQVSTDWIRSRLPLERRTRAELGQQWAEVWVRPGVVFPSGTGRTTTARVQ